MAFKVIVSPLAQKNIEDTIDYYADRSVDAPKKIIIDLNEAYRVLSISPYHKIIYNNFRALPLKKFPFLLMFIISIENEVLIKACFHTSKSTKKYPR